jgi:hypothetical protein
MANGTSLICDTYCPHGAICRLTPPHTGRLHNADGCLFSDAEAIPRVVADAMLLTRPGGTYLLAASDLLRAILGLD